MVCPIIPILPWATTLVLVIPFNLGNMLALHSITPGPNGDGRNKVGEKSSSHGLSVVDFVYLVLCVQCLYKILSNYHKIYPSWRRSDLCCAVDMRRPLESESQPLAREEMTRKITRNLRHTLEIQVLMIILGELAPSIGDGDVNCFKGFLDIFWRHFEILEVLPFCQRLKLKNGGQMILFYQ